MRYVCKKTEISNYIPSMYRLNRKTDIQLKDITRFMKLPFVTENEKKNIDEFVGGYVYWFGLDNKEDYTTALRDKFIEIFYQTED